MRFPTRTTAAVIAFAAGSLALSACSSSGGGSASSTPTPSTSVQVDEKLAAMVPDSIKSDGKLIIGTDASYAPAEFIAEDGTTITGFDVDLGKAIARKLGLEAQFENATFDSIIVGVDKGKYDAGMSSFTINPEREKQANMVSYFEAGTSWAVATGNPAGVNPDDPCGKTVAVQKATVQFDDIEARNKKCTSASKPEINIQQYTLQTDVTTAVVGGKADAMLADSPVVAYAIKQSAGKLEQVGDVYDSAPYGVVVAKDQQQFAQAVQGAVQALITDQQYAEILEAWGVGNGAIAASQVNPVS